MADLPVLAGVGHRPSWRPDRLTVALVALVATVSVASLGSGAAGVPLTQVLPALVGIETLNHRDAVILWDIRLPRLVMGLLVGAALAVAGALMQGLFRNPLADPGLVGVSAGAGLGAVLAIVMGGSLGAWAGPALVPVAAFAGGWAVTLVLARIATRSGRTSVATLLLAGLALGALAGAATGVLVFLADDTQLRDLTFWSLGSLAGASWAKLAVAAPLIVAVMALAPRLGRALDALALGEAAAQHMGVPVEQTKRLAILATAAAAGAAVALSGGIAFVGIVVPHLLRLAAGPGHRLLLPRAALLGGALLAAADIVARSIVAPAELPIGVVTAAIGAPAFLWILLRRAGTGAI